MEPCNRVVVQAAAKVNLSLDITGPAGDGYHLLAGVMLGVELSDMLILSRRGGSALRLTCSDPSVPCGADNTAHRAATAFFAYTGLDGRGLCIHIDKSIPMQAGLAGGSADAAGVLVGLDRLFAAGLVGDRLAGLALEVGADVPFCLRGGCALAEGKGEMLTPLPLPGGLLVIAKPPAGMSTRRAFRLYDGYGGPIERPDAQRTAAAVCTGDLAQLGRCMGNVFESVVGLKEVRLLKDAMLTHGALGAVMSGSGTAVAGLFGGEEEAGRCARDLRERVPHVFLTRPANWGARIVYIE